MEKDFLLIGIDGGATKVNACQVNYDKSGINYSLSENISEITYQSVPGFLSDFKPVDILDQLKDFKEDKINPSFDEEQQEAVFVEACAKSVMDICTQAGCNKVLLGIGMPGLKTADKRGIAVLANGPRMIEFSKLLEDRLALESIKIVRPINRLGSDADYCGIGENFSKEGLLGNLQNVYYLGSGTGSADALKLNGKLIPFDDIKPWMAKTWEMQWTDGNSLEKYVSAKGIQAIYADFIKKSVSELETDKIHLGQIVNMASERDKHSSKAMEMMGEALSALLYERIETLFAGWQGNFTFANPDRKIDELDHPYRELVFDGIVLGQRLGQVLSTPAGFRILGNPLLERLKDRIDNSVHLSDKAKMHYANLEKIIKFSTLRNAPALGAGIDAFFQNTLDNTK